MCRSATNSSVILGGPSSSQGTQDEHIKEEYKFHTEIGAFRQSVANGCHLCTYLYDASSSSEQLHNSALRVCRIVTMPNGKIPVTETYIELVNWADKTSSSHNTFRRFPTTNLRRQPRGLLTPSTASDTCFHLARKWLHLCIAIIPSAQQYIIHLSHYQRVYWI